MIYKVEDIIHDIIKNIESYKQNKDRKLPSENELATYYDVPRATIRKCFDKLEEMGLIYSKQGKGRYLKGDYTKVALRLTGEESFTSKVQGKYSYEMTNIGCEKVDYDHEIYTTLGVERSGEVFKIGLLRFINEEPVALHTSYIPGVIFEDIKEEGQYIKSMYSYFERKGIIDIVSDQSVMRIIYPDLIQCKLLNCNILTPLLRIRAVKKSIDRECVIELSEVTYRSDHFEYIL